MYILRKPRPVSGFSMMDDLLRDYLKLFKSPPSTPHPELTHKKTHFQHFCFPSAAPALRRTPSRVASQFPTMGRPPSQTKTRCVGSVVFLSCLFTSRNSMKLFHNTANCFGDNGAGWGGSAAVSEALVATVISCEFLTF